MYKIRYRKSEVGIDHAMLLCGVWQLETFETQKHYWTKSLDSVMPY